MGATATYSYAGADGRLRRPELRDREHRGRGGEQARQNVSRYNDALARYAAEFRGLRIAAKGKELAPRRGAGDRRCPEGFSGCAFEAAKVEANA